MHFSLQLATSRSVPSIIHTRVPQMCNSSKIQVQNYTNIETHKYEKKGEENQPSDLLHPLFMPECCRYEQEQQILDFPKPSKYELSSRLLHKGYHNSIKHL